MPQQTALQNLIHELKEFKKFPLVDQATIEAAIEFAELRLPMEKEQIMDDFNAGQWAWAEHLIGKEKKDPLEYYNETYGK